MAAKTMSPTASLLKSSRLFSLPPPLPRPATEQAWQPTPFYSDVATTYYPTHAAITTPQSSRHRGDWGLKRNLPRKTTTNTNTPFIQVEALDTVDHITEFNSSAYYHLTLRKFQEMKLPLSVHEEQSQYQDSTNTPTRSVFESLVDDAADMIDATSIQRHDLRPSIEQNKRRRRWKYKGDAWMVGNSTSEIHFQAYVRKQLRKRKAEFQDFLMKTLIKRKERIERQNAMDQGTTPKNISASDSELEAFIRTLRSDKDKSELRSLVHAFLDLPIAYDRYGQDLSSAISATHPSVGLSYLRTNARLLNHPVLGPLAEWSPPVEARVLVPSRGSFNNTSHAKLGVGGIVTNDLIPGAFRSSDKYRSYRQNSDSEEVPAVRTFDPDLVGGGKVWVQPRAASVDEKGRIMLKTQRALSRDVELRKDSTMILNETSVEKRQPDDAIPDVKLSSQFRPSASAASSANTYGLGNFAHKTIPRATALSEDEQADFISQFKKLTE
ncbi:MAG: hypothetical protein M1824_003686 [Vezdaea acicularis]|nr:MAG: hypothetical protein M1824_003686 [Vezdaea acicularis]